MLCQNAVAYQQINMFFNDKVQSRRLEIQKAIVIISEVVQEVLKSVEQMEPRFISTFSQKLDGQYEGVSIILVSIKFWLNLAVGSFCL